MEDYGYIETVHDHDVTAVDEEVCCTICHRDDMLVYVCDTSTERPSCSRQLCTNCIRLDKLSVGVFFYCDICTIYNDLEVSQKNTAVARRCEKIEVSHKNTVVARLCEKIQDTAIARLLQRISSDVVKTAPRPLHLNGNNRNIQTALQNIYFRAGMDLLQVHCSDATSRATDDFL